MNASSALLIFAFCCSFLASFPPPNSHLFVFCFVFAIQHAANCWRPDKGLLVCVIIFSLSGFPPSATKQCYGCIFSIPIYFTRAGFEHRVACRTVVFRCIAARGGCSWFVVLLLVVCSFFFFLLFFFVFWLTKSNPIQSSDDGAESGGAVQRTLPTPCEGRLRVAHLPCLSGDRLAVLCECHAYRHWFAVLCFCIMCDCVFCAC